MPAAPADLHRQELGVRLFERRDGLGQGLVKAEQEAVEAPKIAALVPAVGPRQPPGLQRLPIPLNGLQVRQQVQVCVLREGTGRGWGLADGDWHWHAYLSRALTGPQLPSVKTQPPAVKTQPPAVDNCTPVGEWPSAIGQTCH